MSSCLNIVMIVFEAGNFAGLDAWFFPCAWEDFYMWNNWGKSWRGAEKSFLSSALSLLLLVIVTVAILKDLSSSRD